MRSTGWPVSQPASDRRRVESWASPAVSGDDAVYFDPAVAGRRVQADGGSAAGGRLGSREMFEGRLTGRRLDQGDPPWRWFEIGNLTDKPDGFVDEAVWCEESYIYFADA